MPGSAQCVASISAIFKHMTDEACDAIDEWAKDTMTISQENFCPVKTGKLKSTGNIKTVTGTTREYAVCLSYGEGIDYAIKVHELPLPHYNPPGAQYKFLETPFNMRISSLMSDIQYKCAGVL